MQNLVQITKIYKHTLLGFKNNLDDKIKAIDNLGISMQFKSGYSYEGMIKFVKMSEKTLKDYSIIFIPLQTLFKIIWEKDLD